MACVPCAYFVVITEQDERGVILRLTGELDVTGKDLLESAVGAALRSRPPMLTVDMSELTFMDCAGAMVLRRAHEALAARQSRLLLIGARPIVVRLLSLLGLGTWLDR